MGKEERLRKPKELLQIEGDQGDMTAKYKAQF